MAITTYNSTFGYLVSTSYVTVGAIESIKLSAKSSTVDTTDLSSATRTFMKGIADAGEVALSLNVDPGTTAHDYLRDALFYVPGHAVDGFKITFSDNSLIKFSGFVTDFSINAALDEKLQCDVSIKITGSLTYT